MVSDRCMCKADIPEIFRSPAKSTQISGSVGLVDSVGMLLLTSPTGWEEIASQGQSTNPSHIKCGHLVEEEMWNHYVLFLTIQVDTWKHYLQGHELWAGGVLNIPHREIQKACVAHRNGIPVWDDSRVILAWLSRFVDYIEKASP